MGILLFNMTHLLGLQKLTVECLQARVRVRHHFKIMVNLVV